MDRKSFFDRIAHDWEENHCQEKDKGRLAELFRHFSINKGEVVLDIGCGTGRLVPFLRKLVGSEGRIIESDFSSQMLKIGKSKHADNNVFFIQADAQRIPFRENVFDAIICFALFPHLPDKKSVLVEFGRILKQGKILSIAHLMGREELNRFHSQVEGPVNRDFLPSKEEMTTLLSSAGFSDFDIKDEPGLYLLRART